MKQTQWKCAAAAVLALALAACKQQPQSVPVQQQPLETPGTTIASDINMGAAKQEPQLLNGFYSIEGGAWRWTAKKFTVVLRTPTGAAQSGGTLEFDFTIPEVVIQKEGKLTLNATVAGTPLGAEEYTKTGSQVYRKDIPATALGADSVKVEFTLDKAIPPSGNDHRELGVVANAITLKSK